MRQAISIVCIVLSGLAPYISVNPAFAQRLKVPRDGMFYVEGKPAYAFKATLAEDWVCPHAGDGTLHVYAPVLPELPSQSKVSTRLFVARNDKLKAKEITEASINKRRMLALDIKSDELPPKAGIALRVEYEGTLFARTLKLGITPACKLLTKCTDQCSRNKAIGSINLCEAYMPG